MSILAYLVAGWLMAIGAYGIMSSRNLVHAVVCLAICQSGTYVLLIGVGYQLGAPAPVFGSTEKPTKSVVDPVVQAMTLTDVVVGATVTSLLLALTIQIQKRHGTINPDELRALRG